VGRGAELHRTAVEVDTPLAEGDTLRTDEGASAEVTFDGDSIIQLGQKTELETSFLQSTLTRFSLAWGSLTAKIRKLRQADERVYFKTPVAVAAVRGTELAVTYEGEEPEAVVGVFDEGQVAVQSEGNDDVIVNAGQETSVQKDIKPLAPRPLEKLLVQRPQIIRVRERIEFIKPRWNTLPPLKRQEIRERLLKKPRLQFEPNRPRFNAPPKPERREQPSRPNHPPRPQRRDRR
jgi:hypothetical protein